MGVNLIFRIAAVGILVSVICQVLKHSGREEQAFLTSLAGLVLVLFWMVPISMNCLTPLKACSRCSPDGAGRGSNMTVASIAVIGLISVLLAVELKAVKGEYGVYLVLGAGLVIFFYSLSKLEAVIETIRKVQSYIRLDRVYLEILMKMIGITYIAEFASGICRDAGYGSLGGQIEIFGKLSMLAVSMPILLALMETLKVFMS